MELGFFCKDYDTIKYSLSVGTAGHAHIVKQREYFLSTRMSYISSSSVSQNKHLGVKPTLCAHLLSK
jgi:hypothetical protein